MNIIYSKKACKVIRRIDSVSADRIRAAVEKLPDGDVKQLRGDDITITIEKIAPRGDAYKGL